MLFLLLCAFSSWQTIFAQNIAKPLAPDVAALHHFSQVQVGHYTGTTNVSIPFPSLKGRELSVPISLSHISSGIKVAELPPSTGRNWALSAGGSITQAIRDQHDAIRIAHPIPAVNQFPTSRIEIGNRLAPDYSGSDEEPDIFSYSFLGRSGKLMMDNNLNFHAIPFEPIKVSNLITTAENMPPVIVDENGTKYIFGKKIYDTTPSMGINEKLTSVTHYLTQVINAEQTDTLTFSYEEVTINYDARVYQDHKDFARHFEFLGMEPLYHKPGIPTSFHLDNTNQTFVYISKISSSMGYVDFMYEARGADTELGLGLKNLVGLQYRNLNHELLSHYKLEYGNGLLLSKVINVDVLTQEETYYAMEYYPGSLPDRVNNNYQYDAWGYYNLNNAGHPFPKLVYGFNITDVYANRFPDEQYTLIGSLKKIIYPTKGYTQFYYELNKSKTLTTLDQDLPATNLVGGLRVKRIEDYDGISSKPYNVKKIEYEDGDLSYAPIFSRFWQSNRFKNTYCGECEIIIYDVLTLTGTLQTYACAIFGSPITYTKVKEIYGENGEFGYSTFEYSPSNALPNSTMIPTDVKSYVAGNLLRKTDYNARGIMVKDVVNEFEQLNVIKQPGFTIRFSKEIWPIDWERNTQYYSAEHEAGALSAEHSVFDVQPYELESGWVRKKKETTKSYDANKPSSYSEQIVNFEYDNKRHQQVTKVTTKDSKGTDLITLYKYPDSSHNDVQLAYLFNKNKVASPYLTEKYYMDANGNQKFISGEETFYTLGRPTGKNNRYPYNGTIQSVNQLNLTYTHFNGLLRVTESIRRDGTPTAYFWGFNNSELVMEAFNISHATLKTAVEQTMATMNGYTQNDFETFMRYVSPLDNLDKKSKWKEFNTKLRANTLLSGARIETFSHIPLRGISSKTDANNLSTYYEYDGFGRLAVVRDDDFNIKQLNKYKYAN